MAEETGSVVVYMAGAWAGMVLGAIAGAIIALDGATWARVWQLAVYGVYIGLAVVAFLMAALRGVNDDDAGQRRSDVVAQRDGTGPARD
jgi:hypothetical protein